MRLAFWILPLLALVVSSESPQEELKSEDLLPANGIDVVSDVEEGSGDAGIPPVPIGFNENLEHHSTQNADQDEGSGDSSFIFGRSMKEEHPEEETSSSTTASISNTPKEEDAVHIVGFEEVEDVSNKTSTDGDRSDDAILEENTITEKVQTAEFSIPLETSYNSSELTASGTNLEEISQENLSTEKSHEIKEHQTTPKEAISSLENHELSTSQPENEETTVASIIIVTSATAADETVSSTTPSSPISVPQEELGKSAVEVTTEKAKGENEASTESADPKTSSTEQIYSSSTRAPVPSSTEEVSTIPEKEIETTTEPAIIESDVVSNLTLTVGMMGSIKKNEDITLQESSVANTASMYITIGVIAACILALFILIAIRRTRSRDTMRVEREEDRDTEKALLGNGKDHPDGNGIIKNNEMTPLVFKENGHGEYEKSPTITPAKNINVIASDKNVEKDNVFKSLQENADEDENNAGEEKKTDKVDDGPEKLIVHTHLDVDSIPRRPVIINNNNNGSVIHQSGHT